MQGVAVRCAWGLRIKPIKSVRNRIVEMGFSTMTAGEYLQFVADEGSGVTGIFPILQYIEAEIIEPTPSLWIFFDLGNP